MKDHIREYESKDKELFKKYYTEMCVKKQNSRVFYALKRRKSAQLTWKAGLVGIVGVYLTQFTNHVSLTISIPLLLLELTVWTIAVAFLWYRWITIEYTQTTTKACLAIATQLDEIQSNDKSCAWIMERDGHIIGTVALKYDNREGQVGYLTGVDSRIRLMLVQKAIQFGRANKIEVISKWGNDTKWTDSPL